jgi:regulatory protein
MDGGVITGLHGQRRQPERANLHVDGEFLCGVAWEVVLREGLRAGDAVTGELLERIRQEDEAWRARESMLSLLAVRPRTRRELRDRLRRKGLGGAAVEHAMSEADRLGLLDDGAFAEMWVRDRLRLRPRGARVLEAELRQRGVAADQAAAAVARVMSREGVADEDTCNAIAARWARGPGRRLVEATDPEERRRGERRLASLLQRRGFPSASVRATVRSVMDPNGGARHA